MGSELRCQNFDSVKFREIILRNPCCGTFFSQNFESEFSKNSDPPAKPKRIHYISRSSKKNQNAPRPFPSHFYFMCGH